VLRTGESGRELHSNHRARPPQTTTLGVMKLTLDHNVIIDLVNGAENVARLREMLADERYQAYVVEIGASEMRQRGIRPDRFDLFEKLLDEAGIRALPRLMPMMICINRGQTTIFLWRKSWSVPGFASRRYDGID